MKKYLLTLSVLALSSGVTHSAEGNLDEAYPSVTAAVDILVISHDEETLDPTSDGVFDSLQSHPVSACPCRSSGLAFPEGLSKRGGNAGHSGSGFAPGAPHRPKSLAFASVEPVAVSGVIAPYLLTEARSGKEGKAPQGSRHIGEIDE
jgi:hypothetical protein